MCGIAGLIGTSKKPKTSYKIMTRLFDLLESRGTDAAGCWGLEAKARPSVIYHKAGIKSSEFVKTQFWKNLQNINMNLLLVHARKTSPGIGSAYYNPNNHPFVSADKRIGLIHNGRIHEASFLNKSYDTVTSVDSEFLLRMYESPYSEKIKVDGIPDDINDRILGIHDIYSVVQEGSMAVAIGELHDDGSRSLFLFRNEKRPIWLVDLRVSLGQIFFFSDPALWQTAIRETKLNREIGFSHKVAELPDYEIWSFKIDNEHQIVNHNNFHRLQVIEKESDVWEDVPVKKKVITEKKLKLSIITDLDQNEKAPSYTKPITYGSGGYHQPNNYYNSQNKNYDDYNYDYSGDGWSAKDWRNNSPHTQHQESKSLVVVPDSKPSDEEKTDKQTTVSYNEKEDKVEDTVVLNKEDELLLQNLEETENIPDDEDNDVSDYQELISRYKNMPTVNQYDYWDHLVIEGNCEMMEEQINRIKKVLDNIETAHMNSSLEGNVQKQDFEELMEHLDSIEKDLNGTLMILK